MTVLYVAIAIFVAILLVDDMRLRRSRVPVDEKANFEADHDALADEANRVHELLDEREKEWLAARDELIAAYEREIAAVKLQYAEKKREDARQTSARSRTALVAKVAEHFAPYLDGFNYNPKEARHIGEIIDFIVYEGLEGTGPVTVVFLEVKTKASGRVSNPRERKVRDAIKAGRVRYEVFVPQSAIAAKKKPAIEAPLDT